jgi:Bacterial protein of unknown function (DUF922)
LNVFAQFMIKPIITLLLAATTLFQNSLIPWKASRKLNWEDFKANPDPGSSNAALTSSSINIEFGYDNKGLQYSIRCGFDKTRSWVRIRNDDVLGHEQGHFDLAELYARKLNKVIKEYRFNAKTVGEDVNKLYENMMQKHHEMQRVYDEETDYSRNKVKQEEWKKKIYEDLKDLEAYADYGK